MDYLDFPIDEGLEDDSLGTGDHSLEIHRVAQITLQKAYEAFNSAKVLLQANCDDQKPFILKKLLFFLTDYFNGLQLLRSVSESSIDPSDFDLADLRFASEFGVQYADQLKDVGAFMYFSGCLQWIVAEQAKSDGAGQNVVWH